MAAVRTPSEQSYRSVTNRIGFAMLFFELMLNAVSVVIAVIMVVLEMIPHIDPITKDCINQISYGLLYAAIFMLPVLFFYLISIRRGAQPIRCGIRWCPETIAYLFVGLAIVSATAQINAILVSFFDISVFLPEDLLPTVPTATNNYQLVLMIFTTAVVPAFVEEFLFRGVVLTNLLPYGKTTAVLALHLYNCVHLNKMFIND